MKHEYKEEGSDSAPYRLIGGCTCGWWGTVIDGQGRGSILAARAMWERHVAQEYEESARAAQWCIEKGVA